MAEHDNNKVENLDETEEGRTDYPGGVRPADIKLDEDAKAQLKKEHDKLPKVKVPNQEDLDDEQPDKPTEPQKAKEKQAKADLKTIQKEQAKDKANKPSGDKQTGGLTLGQQTKDAPTEPQADKMKQLSELLEKNPEYKAQAIRDNGALDTFKAVDGEKALTPVERDKAEAEAKEKADKDRIDAESKEMIRLQKEEHIPGFKTPLEVQKDRDDKAGSKTKVRITVANNTVQYSFEATVPGPEVKYGEFPLNTMPLFVSKALQDKMNSSDYPKEFTLQFPHFARVEEVSNN